MVAGQPADCRQVLPDDRASCTGAADRGVSNCSPGAGINAGIFAERCLGGPRLMVAIGIAWCAGAAAGNYLLSWIYLLPFCLAGLSCALAAKRIKAAVLLSGLPILSFAYSIWRLPGPAPDDLSCWIKKRHVIFCARVETVLPASPYAMRAVVSCREILFPCHQSLSGRTILTVRGGTCVPGEGDEIKVNGLVSAPEPARYPWDFDYARYLRRQGIFSLCSGLPGEVLVVRKAGCAQGACVAWAKASLDCLRARLTAVHRRFAGVPEGDLLQSMVLGDRCVELPEDITRRFRDLGLSHILAASGFNITVVTGVTWWLGRFLIKSVWALNLVSFFTMLLYVGLAGPSPSVVRAAMMCSLVLLSRCLFRCLYVPGALSLSLLVTLIVDPGAVADIGLQLSYAATAGIICGAHPLSRLLKDSMCLKLPGWLSESVAVIVIAQASVLPIQLTYFWQVGLFFLPANLIISPIVTVVTIAGFLSSALVMLDFTGLLTATVVALLDGFSAYPLKLMLFIVNTLSSYDEARIHPGAPGILAVALFYLCLTFVFVTLRWGRFRIAGMLALIITLVVLLWRPASPALTLAFFPGAAIFVDGEHRFACLGDGQGKVLRFLLHCGVNPAKQSHEVVCVRQISAAVQLIVSRSLPLSVLLIDGSGKISLPPGLPPCSITVVTAPCKRASSLDLPAGSTGSACKMLPGALSCRPQQAGSMEGRGYSLPGGQPDVAGITELVKQSGSKWVILHDEDWRCRRRLDLLEDRLREISGLQVMRLQRHEIVFTAAGCRDNKNSTLELKQWK